jgi:hypothetical protein
MPNTKIVPASPEAEACRQALVAAIGPYADKLGAQGMLVVASALVGQLIAMQDQRSMTPAMAMEIVRRNIEQANQEVLANLAGPAAGHA